MTFEKMYIQISAIIIGFILTIQIVHYPSFYFVHKMNFSDFESFHQMRTSLIAVPLMLLELALCLYLLYRYQNLQFSVQLAFIVMIWAVTFFWSVPCHNKLSIVKDEAVIKSLLSSNLVRTILWVIKYLLLSFQGKSL